MVRVKGHWEIGYNTPIIEANYWNLALRDFEVTEWSMSPVSGIEHNEERIINLTEHQTYEEYFESLSSGVTRVFIEPKTEHINPDTIWLHDFEHPLDCVYIFGSAHYNPTVHHKREQDVIVSIKTIQNKGVLWSHQCLPIVLYDRMIKGWQ